MNLVFLSQAMIKVRRMTSTCHGKILLLASLTLPGFGAWAQMSDSGTKPAQAPARLEMRNQAAYFVLADGREAALFVNYGKIQKASFSLKQIENTCLPGLPLTTCDFSIQALPYELSLRWVHHPDPAKIGEVVVVQGNPARDAELFMLRHQALPKFQKILDQDRLTCQSLTWLEQAREKSPGLFLIQSWSGEFMSQNNETKLNENQSLASQFNLLLQKVSSNEVALSDYGVQIGITSPLFFTLGGVTNLTFLSKKNEVCQVSFQVDTSQAAVQLNGGDRKPLPPQGRTLLTEPLQPLENSTIQDQIQRLLRANSGPVEIE